MNRRSRLDKELAARGLAPNRSQAESLIRMGWVKVNGRTVFKPGQLVDESDRLSLTSQVQYVSRAAHKLDSAASRLGLDFHDKLVLDVGSSTGGFTEYALRHGARRVIAVDVGTEQLHPSLRTDSRIELHEKTDIRDFSPKELPDIVLIDVSFISLRQILPAVAAISGPMTQITAMLKPQFEAGVRQISRGVIKNETIRRQIIRDFETWLRRGFVVEAKADSGVEGAKGNLERFYLLRKITA